MQILIIFNRFLNFTLDPNYETIRSQDIPLVYYSISLGNDGQKDIVSNFFFENWNQIYKM